MNNKEIKFKTNLNCGGCVSKVQQDLDSTEGISTWHVDTENKDKILTIEGEVEPEKVIEIVKNKGFDIEYLDK